MYPDNTHIYQLRRRIKSLQTNVQINAINWVLESRSNVNHDSYVSYTNPIPYFRAAVRSGDYYLFEDMNMKIELDMMTDKTPAVVSDVQLRQRLASKQTIEQVRRLCGSDHVILLIFGFGVVFCGVL